ncbi:MAG: aminotransferase class I/II-fold pyridoxal phosphate-dependent enzyme [Vicinamibacteria bacterium]|nr:aminotransferase class I/II-fold pyridoxal phosphate-dependent enzyme [Vicinamibacteria bacterium]
MALSRRRFVESLGAATATMLGGRLEAASQAPRPYVPPPPDPLAIRLDSNENPEAPSSAVSKAVVEALAQGNRYPRNAFDLAEALAKTHGVTRDNIFLGAGSGELLKAAVPAFVDAKRHLVSPVPTFNTCLTVARSLELPVREVPIDSRMLLDLAGIEAASAGAGLLYLCNPNNPTATLLPTKDIEGLLDRLAQRSPETVVILDEAYAHFVGTAEYRSLATRAASDPRLLVFRTFSKVYGLAGLRMGYAVGHPDTLKRLRLRTTSDFLAVTSVAAALAALGDDAVLKARISSNRDARALTVKEFETLGFTVFPSEANFILVDVRTPAAEFGAACRKEHVAIGRPFPGLTTQVRISIGTVDEMRRATAVFKRLLAPAA